jgi:hypothetical protein
MQKNQQSIQTCGRPPEIISLFTGENTITHQGLPSNNVFCMQKMNFLGAPAC